MKTKLSTAEISAIKNLIQNKITNIQATIKSDIDDLTLEYFLNTKNRIIKNLDILKSIMQIQNYFEDYNSIKPEHIKYFTTEIDYNNLTETNINRQILKILEII